MVTLGPSKFIPQPKMDAEKKKNGGSQVPDLGAPNWANWQNCFLNDWYGEIPMEEN